VAKAFLTKLGRVPCNSCMLGFSCRSNSSSSSPTASLLSSASLVRDFTTGSLLSNRSVQDLSFIMAILSSSHHESLKAQKAINELFVKYNIQFSGVSKSFFRISDKDNHTCGLGFSDLVSQIGSMSFDSTGLHWRYNLMANRVLLLLALASRNHPNSSTRILSETTGHFLKNLKSQLPQTRILAISALNTP
ncbi:hypothetical protein S83_058177, partial [Arachis hypogaea]